MAKGTGKSGGTARVRFIMLDAEVPDGDLSQITTAIPNAFKPTTIIQRLPNGNGAKAITHDPAEPPPVEEEVENELTDETPSAPRAPRTKRTVSKMPKVVDIDMNSGVSFAAFANGKDSGSQHKKYLIAAAWLKEHRETPAVNEGHIFTCFKSIGWPLNIADFAQPLRELNTKRQFFEKTTQGYEINHLGLDYVNKLGGSNGAG